jgi:transcriptional regulator, propionate catabolism operon regulatory protein
MVNVDDPSSTKELPHMTKDKFRFALAVHSTEVVRRVQECTKFMGETIQHRIVSFDGGEQEARGLLAKGYEVILCHGGTGETILRAIGHSVVLIQKTDMDVIRALFKARELTNEVALTVHANEFRDLEFMQHILGMKIHEIRYATKEELLQGVDEVYRKGVRLVIGGGVSRVAIENKGGTGLIIEPNSHCILQAIEQARSMAKAKREESQNREQLIAILKLLGEGVLFIDVEKNIVFANSKAKQYLKLSGKNQAQGQFQKYFDVLNLNAVLGDGVPRLNSIISLHGEKFVVNTLPVAINAQLRGAVVMFRDTTSIQDISNLIREELNQRGLVSGYTVADLKGASPHMARLITKVERFAQTCSSILIDGETGSGKELVAHAIHDLSARRDKAFVAVNCSALPESLLESELFGYEEGAFTGAKRGGKVGLFELANRGTIFLDEIGDISHCMQLRLLRVLEAKEVMRLGGDKIIPVDVRIVSASHRNLMSLVQQGCFRMDLFFRLGVLQLHVPPLRQRTEDIPILVENLLARFGKRPGALTPGMLEMASAYDWPGNIRELLSFFESYFVLLGDEEVNEELFRELFQDRAMPAAQEPCEAALGEPGPDGTLKEQLRHYRRAIIHNALKHSRMNRQVAAKKLGISYNTLWRVLAGKENEVDEA